MIWDLLSETCVITIKYRFLSSLVALNGSNIVGGYENGSIIVWDIKSGDCIKTIYGHYDAVNCMIKLSNNQIASGGNDRYIKIWNL